ncbi:DUF4012 domain-containing protein [Marisediminicola sp. LYQ85]|uniref:DUF4012 domain-containing protein n=1 Tax=Marisediminicola sp. LYQ85 TaxID=3391062 RepID=UPI003983B202
MTEAALPQGHGGVVAGSAGRQPWRRRALLAAIIVVVVLAVAVAWVAFRSLAARGELEGALPAAEVARSAILAGDVDGAAAAVRDVETRVVSAERLTSDPVFALATALPFVGPNLEAFRTVITSLDEVTRNALVPLVGDPEAMSVEALLPVDGRIDIEALERIAPVLTAADRSFERAVGAVRSVDTSRVVSPVGDAVDELESVLAEASTLVSSASRAADLLPAALGADGDRNYVLVFQNNAEVRATGGLPGSLALVSTSDGRFELTGQASAESFPTYPDPVIDVDAATQSLYGGLTARLMQNTNSTPDFATAAEAIAAMWERQYGVDVDGVIAVDPVLLSYLLEASGPVELSTGDVIDSDNAVPFLLSDVYARYPDPDTQDLVFADAARAVFDTLSTDSLDPAALADALARGGAEHRILLWNARDDEQARLAGTTLAGGLPATNDGATAIGVYFNDATGAKLGIYLDADVSLDVDACNAESLATYATTVDLASSVPLDGGTSLPERVTAGGVFGVERGTVRTRAIVYGPVGSRVTTVEVDGAPTDAQTVEHLGRPAVQVIVDLPPTTSASVSVEFALELSRQTPPEVADAATDGATDPVITVTPLIREVPTRISSRDCGTSG